MKVFYQQLYKGNETFLITFTQCLLDYVMLIVVVVKNNPIIHIYIIFCL